MGSESKKLENKTALVTGASRGIGRAIALELARNGANVVLNYCRSADAAQEVLDEIEKAGGTAISVQGDVGDSDQAEKVVDQTVEKFERIDVLVNNAGIIRDNLVISMEKDDWDGVISTNLGGVFNFTKAVARPMMMQKSGKVINISSIAGEHGGKGQSNYAASKAAINAFTRVMAIELAPKGILVNAVAPGMILTEMSSTVRSLTNDAILNNIPLGRYGTPEAVAKVVAFMASDDANYITGQVITVDGGLTLGVKM